jgi:hypothetical protein
MFHTLRVEHGTGRNNRFGHPGRNPSIVVVDILLACFDGHETAVTCSAMGQSGALKRRHTTTVCGATDGPAPHIVWSRPRELRTPSRERVHRSGESGRCVARH